MFFKNHKSFVALSFLVLFGFLAGGCASTSFVKKRTQEIEDMAKANQAQIGELEQKVSAADAKAEEAKSKADDAREKAARSRGYVGYKVIGEREVNFDFDKYNLPKTAKDILDEIGNMMQEGPALILEIEGHTDNAGPDAYNTILGKKRAESVKRYLTEKFDIHIHRMFYISHGESQPKILNDTRTGRATNRRATLLLLGPPE